MWVAKATETGDSWTIVGESLDTGHEGRTIDGRRWKGFPSPIHALEAMGNASFEGTEASSARPTLVLM